MISSDSKIAFVTGATGFVGYHLVNQLVRDGWQVHIVVRSNSTVPVSHEFSKVSIHVHDGTVENMVCIVSDIKPTVAFHLASLFLSQHDSNDVDKLIISNLLFGSQLLEALKVNNVKCLVNTGTSWQHYENKTYSPVNLYSATKQAFEALVQYYVEAHDLKVITLKLFDTYGTKDTRPKLMNLLKRISKQSQLLEMSPGEQYIDLVYVDDVVRAYVIAADRLISKEVVGHEGYAVSSGKPMLLKELVKRVEQEAGVNLKINWGGRAYRNREVMTPWKGNLLPGWAPQISMSDAIRRVFSE